MAARYLPAGHYYLPVVSKVFFSYRLYGVRVSEDRIKTIKADPTITNINDSIEQSYKMFCEYLAERYSKIDYEYIGICGMKAEFRDKALAPLNICFYSRETDAECLMQSKIYKPNPTNEKAETDQTPETT